jgi:Antirestriction protein
MNQPTDINSDTQKIEAYTVSHHARMGTLPRHFGRHMMTFEGMVYDLMRQFSPHYGGGMWAYLELSNGSFYMTPPPDKSYRLTIHSNGYDGEMTADAAGITVCLFAYSLLSIEHRGTDVFTRHFHRLRDFALGHAESAQIFAAID